MDFSKGNSIPAVRGEELISNLVDLTDLPVDMIRQELEGIITQAGCEQQTLTLDELRLAMMRYLEQMADSLE